MKFLKGRYRKKIIAMILVFTIIGGGLNHIEKIESKAQDVTKKEDNSEFDGIEESILIDEQDIVKCESKDISSTLTEVISYKKDGSKILNKVSAEGIKTYYYDKVGKMVYEENIDFSAFEEIEEPYSSTRKGGAIDLVRIYEIFNRKHWYQRISPTLYIGCDKEYSIYYDSLDRGKKAHCDEYREAINTSNNLMALGVAALVGLIIAAKNALPGIVAMILKLAGEGMTKKQIAVELMKHFGKIFTKLEIANKAVQAVLKVVDAVGFLSNRNKIKKYYKIIREYDPTYNFR